MAGVLLTNITMWQAALMTASTHTVVQNVLTNNPLQDSFVNREQFQTTNHIYSHQVEPRAKITNQKSSGRCWIFAALNVIRKNMLVDFELKDFEFSQSYLFFWDKLERSNYVLESVIDASSEHMLNSQTIQHLLSDPLSDGGQWDMIANLINKYGLVPKSVYPESRHSSYSREMNSILTYKVRQFSRDLINHSGNISEKRELKNKMLKEIYGLLSKFLGNPPTSFDWEYQNKKGYQVLKDQTPITFYKDHVSFDVNDYYCLINDPRKNHPYNNLYTVKYLGNVVEGYKVRYLNLPIERLKEVTKKSLLENNPVWFGCDVGKEHLKSSAVMDLNLLSYEIPLETKFDLTKEERLEYKQSLMTHAMVFTGCNIIQEHNAVCGDRTKVNRWEVENSWAEKGPAKGYYMMTDDWFSEYVYEVLIHKKYLNDDEKKIINNEKYTVLSPWDPMGALA
jgi:bleomycin hydrolase